MNTHKLLSLLRPRHLIWFVFALSVVGVSVCGPVHGQAQDAEREGATAADVEEREFKNAIPPHVPIKVKLKKELAVKDVRNKDWARDLELEVKNTGSKPIYCLYLSIHTVDVLSESGHPLAFQVHYGRKELVRFSTPLLSDDVPILPGETVTLKIPDDWVRGYEYHRGIKNRPDPKKMTLNLLLINFGDGTGLLTHEGAPHPDPARKRSQNAPRREGVPDTGPRAPDTRGACSSAVPRNSFFSTSPASFLRVNFSLSGKFSISGSTPQSTFCGCQNSNDCEWGVIDTPSCCDDSDSTGFLGVFPAGGCSNPDGRCFRTKTTDEPCPPSQVGNPPTQCQFQEPVGPCAIGDPTPTPTPAPTPAPTPCPPPKVGIYLGDQLICRCRQSFDPGGTDCTDRQAGLIWCERLCRCVPSEAACNQSPVVVDTAGDGFNLTSGAGGVFFDIDGDGAAEKLSWTAAWSDDAWLALDRDGNGTVDNGQELFGNFTPQPEPPAGEERNGFLALAAYDQPENGGNGDGVMDKKDAIFNSLWLWQDASHNGISEAVELHTLMGLGLKSIDLGYRESRRADRYGNRFRYRAKVKDSRGYQLGRWAWDVYLVRAR